MSLSRASARLRVLLWSVNHTPHEVGQNDKHEGVQQQTSHLGRTFGGGNPGAEQRASHLIQLRAGNESEHGKGDDLLREVHFFVLCTEKKISIQDIRE